MGGGLLYVSGAMSLGGSSFSSRPCTMSIPACVDQGGDTFMSSALRAGQPGAQVEQPSEGVWRGSTSTEAGAGPEEVSGGELPGLHPGQRAMLTDSKHR